MGDVVLLSGGIDSLVCAELARKGGRLAGCVFVDYGHPAQQAEGWKAFAYCGERGVPLRVAHAFGLDLGDMADGVGAQVVPHRNAVLLALAANAARALGGSRLVIGVTAEDQQEYTDCQPAFLDCIAAAVGVPIDAPLIAYRKIDVIGKARALQLRQEEAWSCYGPGPEPCGECSSCRQSNAAWQAYRDGSGARGWAP